ncbi:hypothetical protein Nepgr_028074 [Nepenthes gracilis]|uniref:Aspergillus nuclease S1 n=1 Tax=Nepenthes gracilis TaxID=150966 RepID=A0AAD3TBR4_NEPGR|nr:hypothetical protein Nepgr_028074 [Nepenthes gracilis]
MRSNRRPLPLLASLCVLFVGIPGCHGWGWDGHYTTCKLAEPYYSNATVSAIQNLLAPGQYLPDLCSWADDVRSVYKWSAALHFADVPDDSCVFNYTRDCHDEYGVPGRCVVAAICNYTTQLIDGYSSGNSPYNLTQALLFLSHFMGDIHQPLHLGHEGDRGGNSIIVYWYNTRTNLHHVWDTSMIYTEEDDFYNGSVDQLEAAIAQNITSDEVQQWQTCSGGQPPCPIVYASESVALACEWAYNGVTNYSTLGDDYFYSRWPIVQQQLSRGGVRLAAALNRIFGSS